MIVLRYLGYAALFLASFVYSIYLTFPWDAAKDRILAIASAQSGAEISARSLKPDWITGFVAEDVRIKTKGSTEPMQLQRVEARVHLLPLLSGARGGFVRLPVAKGALEATVRVDAVQTVVKAEAKGLELGLVPGLAEASGLPLSGTVSMEADLNLDAKNPQNTSGRIGLSATGLAIEKGGKLGAFPVPELALGNLEWNVPIEKGKALFKEQKLSGDNVEAMVDGEIAFLSPIERSALNLSLGFKPTDAFLKKEPLLGALLNNIRQAKGSDGFYTYAVTGSVKHPRFSPRARR